MKNANSTLVHGQIIGKFLDRPIYEWVEDRHGARYEFVRALTELNSGHDFDISITVNECIIMPGLLYRKPAVLIDSFLPSDSDSHQYL